MNVDFVVSFSVGAKVTKPVKEGAAFEAMVIPLRSTAITKAPKPLPIRNVLNLVIVNSHGLTFCCFKIGHLLPPLMERFP